MKGNYTYKDKDRTHKENDISAEYRQVYLDRKAYELARAPEMSDIHAHKRALRYMMKRYLRNLWVAWRRLTPRPDVQPLPSLPVASAQ